MSLIPGQHDPLCVAEGGMRAKGVRERRDEARLRDGIETLLEPEPEDVKGCLTSLEPQLAPADKSIAEQHRQDVVAPAPFRLGDVDLPDVVEIEQRPEQRAIPDERVERGEEGDARFIAAGMIGKPISASRAT